MDMQVELAEREMDRRGAEADRQGQAYADLCDEFVEALESGELSYMLPTPANRYAAHMSLIDWIEDDIAGEDSTTLRALLCIVGDAAQGKPVATAAGSLIHGLARKYAENHAAAWGSE